MVGTVVLINTLISVILLFIAWRIWRLLSRISRIANALTNYERKTNAVLHRVPAIISKGEKGVNNLRGKTALKQQQIQKVQQLFRMLLVGIQIWQRYIRRKAI